MRVTTDTGHDCVSHTVYTQTAEWLHNVAAMLNGDPLGRLAGRGDGTSFCSSVGDLVNKRPLKDSLEGGWWETLHELDSVLMPSLVNMVLGNGM